MLRKVFWVLMVAIATALLLTNYSTLIEAYGSGPPYYSRTTNMDKWINPWPSLITINVLGVALLGFLGYVQSVHGHRNSS